ncbi:Uncharacterised protein [Staphylococcus devriesei]|nr:Uncharacterised protein [Staphylococcus devriesei]
MKYRVSAGVIFLIIIIIFTFFIHPMIDLNNQLLDLVYVITLFTIGSILGYIGRRLDNK